MPIKPFLIGPLEQGEQNNVKPFYLPEDAYFDLEDVYVWRGRLKKRFGYAPIGMDDFNSRLRINIGTTDGSGNLDVAVPGIIFKLGQMFSIGSDVYTVNQLGTTATITNITQANPGEVTTSAAHGFSNGDLIYIDLVQGMTQVNQAFYTITVTGATTFTLGIDTTAFGAYTSGGVANESVTTLATSGMGFFASSNGFAAGFRVTGGPASTDVYFYPAEPVMGLRTREQSTTNLETTIAFDTQFAYERSGNGWDRLGAPTRWTGDNSQFFWSCNYKGANPYDVNFYVTNFNVPDNIKFIAQGASTWTNFRPQLDSGAGTRFLETCRIILPFKDRLVALNTIELEGGQNRTHQNRCRFSQNGDPTNPANSWLDDVVGRGGFIDAPTEEAIITAEFIKDRLLVYFERSTFELVYTGDRALPFRWQQINNELGCESTFSVVGFDTSVMGVGNVGIHSSNSINVVRIDEKIPEEVFRIHNKNDGTRRVYGIRDYYNELVYWTFPDSESDPVFPTRILVYNYVNNSWAFFNDSFTCFGYFQKETDSTWESERRWRELNNPWNSAVFQAAFPKIIAGNQQGFVFAINNDSSFNSPSLSITDMNPATREITVIDNNLKQLDYILIEDATGITFTDGINLVQIEKIDDMDPKKITIDNTFSGTYTGNGKISRISNLKIVSKQFNPGTPIGKQFRVPYIDFLLDKTTDGEISVDYWIDTISSDTIQQRVDPGVLLGSNVLYTKPEDTKPSQMDSDQIWHRYYLETESQFLQLLFFMSDEQMRNLAIARSNFVMHAMIFYVEPQGRIIG